MRYLFFDIECSDGTHIMSFGYVITDENFNVIKKEDILMNPEAIFHTGAWSKQKRMNEPGVEMAYPKEIILKQPTFPHYYKKIKELITAPNQLVIGFSHKNDTVFLDKACTRYGLSSIDYDFYDVQVIHKEAKNLSTPFSTEKIIGELGLNVDKLKAHKSDDDAEVSMLVTKNLCGSLNLSISELLNDFPNSAGTHRSYKTVYLYKTRAESLIKVINRDSTSGSNLMKHNNLTKFWGFTVDLLPDKKCIDKFKNVKFTVSQNYFKTHFREMLIIVQSIIDRGGNYVRYPIEADVFAYDDSIVCNEMKSIKSYIKKGKSIEVVTMDKLFAMLDIDDDYLKKVCIIK